MRAAWRLMLLCLALPLCFGCEEARPDRVPVSGQVLIDGQPLSFGVVRFVPDGARPSSGDLDQQGRFTLTCYDGNDGAVPGRHRVEISAGELQKDNSVRWHAPEKYNRYDTSGVEIDVDGPTDSLVIKLTWEGQEPFSQPGSLEW